jgi:hypothetical protein
MDSKVGPGLVPQRTGSVEEEAVRRGRPRVAMSDSSGAGGTSPAVSVIVVSYKTSSLTMECLRSVVAETSEPCELIVLDNASPDGSADAIAAEHAAGEYLLLLNPDTVVLDGAIDELLRLARRTPAARIWGGRSCVRHVRRPRQRSRWSIDIFDRRSDHWESRSCGCGHGREWCRQNSSPQSLVAARFAALPRNGPKSGHVEPSGGTAIPQPSTHRRSRLRHDLGMQNIHPHIF